MAALPPTTEQGTLVLASAAAAAATVDPNHARHAPLAVPPSPPTGDGAGYCTTTKRISAVAGLPDDVLVDILSRLPLKLLFRYKCVSRAWRGLIAARCLSQIAPTLQGFFHGSGGTKAHAYGGFVNLLGRSAAPPVDASFSFLTANLLPAETDTISLMDSCNGLMLFRHRRRRCSSGARADTTMAVGYIVCNPATKEWVPVPDTTGGEAGMVTVAYIIFHPAVSSSRFQLVQFLLDHSGKDVLQVHTYSSDSREWIGRAVQCWSRQTIKTWMSAFVNGMLHLSVSLRGGSECHRNVIVVVDGEGQRRRVIDWPVEERGSLVFLGQSQGLLHCISGRRDPYGDMAEVSISVLKDYGAAETEEWILKGKVSWSQLFGQAHCWCLSHSIVAIHPDQNLVFFYHLLKKRLVSYNIDSDEVSDLCTLQHDSLFPVTPYFPYFGQSSALAIKH